MKKEQQLKIEEGKGTRQGRVYNLTKEDAEANPAVIQGTLFILDTPVHALTDPGSTHSFISHALARNLRVETESMGCLMVISTRMGKSMKSSEMVKECKVSLSNVQFLLI